MNISVTIIMRRQALKSMSITSDNAGYLDLSNKMQNYTKAKNALHLLLEQEDQVAYNRASY